MPRAKATTSPHAARADLVKMQGTIRLLRSSVEKIDQVVEETGMPRAAVIRLATAEGLRKLFPAA